MSLNELTHRSKNDRHMLIHLKMAYKVFILVRVYKNLNTMYQSKYLVYQSKYQNLNEEQDYSQPLAVSGACFYILSNFPHK